MAAIRKAGSLILNLTRTIFPNTLTKTSRSALLLSETSSKLPTTCVNVLKEKRFSSSVPKPQQDRVKVVFLLRDGRRQEVKAKVGDNLLDVITENDIDIDGFGACEGTLACSTCHLIFKPEDYAKIPEKPTDEELDMLDLAYGLSDTSRLGCQVIVTKDMDGLEITVPKGVADARSPNS